MNRDVQARWLLALVATGILVFLGAIALAADEKPSEIDWNRAQKLYDRAQAGETLAPEDRDYLNRARQARARGEGRQGPGQKAAAAAPQGQIDFQRAQQLMQKSRSGEKLTAEEQAYLERAQKARAANSAGAPAVAAYDDLRSKEIIAKRQRGEKITEEERLYLESRRDAAESRVERQNQENSAKRNADFAKAHPARELTGLVPLTELGKQTYQGAQGGLYPGGENTPPAAHLQAGLRLAAQIVPLDPEGRPSPDGRIVFCAIGMSNTTQEMRSFLKLIAYLWADGLKGRKDELVWKREDLGPDGTHPSLLGREKVARLLLDFLKNDPTSRPWFVK